MRLPLIHLALLPALLSVAACSIDVGNQGYIVRDETRYVVDGVADLDLATFDGPIEVRGWNRDDITVEIERRARDQAATQRIEVRTEQKGRTITVDVRYAGSSAYIGMGTFTAPTARIIVNAPRRVNVTARSGDGSILVSRLEGRVHLATADGSVRASDTSGELIAESGDGSIQCQDVDGHIEAHTEDGTVRVSGTPSVLRVRSGDGSIVLRILGGAAMTDDWTVTTADGSIMAELPAEFHAMIVAEPGSGDRIRSDLVLLNAVGGTRDERSLRGQLGSGGKTLMLRSGDGSIRLTHY